MALAWGWAKAKTGHGHVIAKPAIAITGAWRVPPLLLWSLWTQIKSPAVSPLEKPAARYDLR